MKPNEAPEKIYLFENPIDNTPDDRWLSKRYCKDDIEYTCTDAFIEKAEKYFIEKFEVEDYNDYIDVDGSPIFNYGRFVEDFKNYMKGGEK